MSGPDASAKTGEPAPDRPVDPHTDVVIAFPDDTDVAVAPPGPVAARVPAAPVVQAEASGNVWGGEVDATQAGRSVPVADAWGGDVDATQAGRSAPAAPAAPDGDVDATQAGRSVPVVDAWGGDVDATQAGRVERDPRREVIEPWGGEVDATQAGRIRTPRPAPSFEATQAGRARRPRGQDTGDLEIVLPVGAVAEGTERGAASATAGSSTVGNVFATRRDRVRSDRLRAIDPKLAQAAAELAAAEEAWLLSGARGPLTGGSLGDFTVGGLIGSGAMGQVYRGRQISLDRRVAIKVLPPALVGDRALVERFATEAHTAGLVLSPHVVQVYHAGEHDGTLFYAMEFVEGSDLHQRIKQARESGQPIHHEQAARWVLQSARGLAAAAAHSVVHRDIKPQNLLLSKDGQVKIADFGVAKVLNEQSLTLTGNMVGTPAYCSPEQSRAEKIDGRSDLYSLGCVFYELLALKRPYEGANADAILYQHCYGEPKRLLDLLPDLPPVYEAVCMRLLMKDPAQRYPDAAALADDLERILGNQAVEVPAYHTKFGTGGEEALRQRMGWRRRALPAVVVAATVVLALTAWWLVARMQEADELVRRRAALAALDRTVSVPRGAAIDLDWVAHRLGQGDKDVQRWRAKLGRLDALRTRLARLDAEGALPAALRREAGSDLAAWTVEVGEGDPDGQRWRSRLDQADASDRALRKELAALDGEALPALALVARLERPLAVLAASAGEDDPGVRRWRARGAEALKRRRELAQELPILGGDGALREDALARLADGLAIYAGLVGADDREVQAWTRALAARRETLAQLRANCARLDAVDRVSEVLQAELAGDLARLTILAAPGDAKLAAWQAKISASNERSAALRRLLGEALDIPGDIPPATAQAAARWLGEYRALVSPDDGRLVAWQERIDRAQARVEELTKVLDRLAREEPLGEAEQRACSAALASLESMQALPPERLKAAAARLAVEAARLSDLRSALGRPDQPVTEARLAALASLENLCPGADPQVTAWKERRERYTELRAVLTALDRCEPLPPGSADLLVQYASLVASDDADLRRWRVKVARVAEIGGLLAPLQRAEPPPTEAAALLDELTERLTGPDDPLVRSGRAKLEAIARLTATCQELEKLVSLPADDPRLLAPAGLGSLVGEGEPRLAAWSERARRLAGPPRPSWAAGSGADGHGPWVLAGPARFGLRLRLLPGPSALVGSPADETGRKAEEPPPRLVPISGLWVQETEVTVGQWRQVMEGAEGFAAEDGRRPQASVSRVQAEAFCAALARMVPGLQARLPTGEEWEAACRAGQAGPYSGPVGALPEPRLAEVAWFGLKDGARPVARLAPNALGLFDLHGNLWEWTCSDDRDGKAQVRGGAWSEKPSALRAASVAAIDQNTRSRLIGFRVVVPVEWGR